MGFGSHIKHQHLESLIVMLSVPFALTGGFWLIDYLGYNMSVAVAVVGLYMVGIPTQQEGSSLSA